MRVENTLKSPIVSRYWAWSQERFPLINIFSSLLLYTLAFASFAESRTSLGREALPFFLQQLLFAFAVALHFLTLRVLDEHKDYQSDLKTHPERVLSRGVINLSGLRKLGCFAVICELIITLTTQASTATIAWIALMAWTGLMTVEFFIPSPLKQNLLLYSISHMLVMPFLITWAAALSHPDLFKTENLLTLALLIGLTFCNGLIYEILRKSKGADEERHAVDTFSKRWGHRVPANIAIGLHLVSLILFICLLTIANHAEFDFRSDGLMDLARHIHVLPLILPFLGLGLVFISLENYARKGSSRERKANEGASALFVLMTYLTLIVLYLR